MTIKRTDSEFVCKCDECGIEHYGGGCDDFQEFVEQLKEEDWSIIRDGDKWNHVCAECMRS